MPEKIEQQPMPDAGEVRFFTVAQYAGFRPLEEGWFEVSLVTDTGLRIELKLDEARFCNLANGIASGMRRNEA